ncbi:MAG: BrnT family toxin [Terracidiphilus sp.]
MDTSVFDWDSENIGHIAKHNVAPEESEEVILGEPLDIGFDLVDDEERWSYIGETSDGRILWITITLRGKRMRVVTAFEPEKHWKVFYLEETAGLQ